MLKLCGFPVSNYQRKVKMALLEKGVPYQEVKTYPSQDEAILRHSPLGKIPYLEVGEGCIAESQVIVEYIEDAYPQLPLYPLDPLERAKCRELITVIELHLELPARRLYAEAFFGGTVPQWVKDEVAPLLAKGARALAQLVRFAPFIAGPTFSYADCAAYAHLPLVAGASKTVLGEDALASIGGLKDYLGRIRQRASAAKADEERKANLEEFTALRKKQTSAPAPGR